MLVCCDLHTHSSFSDGSLTPGELAQAAADKGVKYWALTDHDTIDGLPEAATAAGHAGIILIPGVEISVEDYQNRPFHLLGLGIDGRDESLRELCRRQTERRRIRFLEICERLKTCGIGIDGENLLSTFRGAPGRVQIARELISRKLVKSIEEAFFRYLGTSSGNAVPFQKTVLEEAVTAIRKDGGWAFAAHPLSLNLNWEQTETFLTDIRNRGVAGAEVAHSGASLTRQRYVQAIVQRLHMLMCGGSDFHGTGKPKALLGRLSNGKPIPITFLPDVIREKYCQSSEKSV